jgi:hypothetical protein
MLAAATDTLRDESVSVCCKENYVTVTGQKTKCQLAIKFRSFEATYKQNNASRTYVPLTPRTLLYRETSVSDYIMTQRHNSGGGLL